MTGLVDRFIAWATRGIVVQPVVTFEGLDLFHRYEFVRRDEWPDSWWDSHKEQCTCHFCPVKEQRPSRLPWWLPVNAFLHHWQLGPDTPESFHDHPRWSITICLKGKIIERTPWGERVLTPGPVVKIIEMETVMTRPHHCGECERSAKMIFDRSPSGVSFEFVQTGGDDQPEWLEPKMRRVA